MLRFLRRPIGRSGALLAIAVAANADGGTAVAQSIDAESGRIPGLPEPSIGSSLPRRLADPGGVRSALARRGVLFGLNYIGEVFGNPTGGFRQGAVYDGRFELQVQADLEKMLGLKGLSFFANAYQIHGEGLSAANLGVLMPVSFIEADPATRLSELWLEQKLYGNKVSIRFGELALDTEFMVSAGGTELLNGTWGWPALAALNMPQNGPAYPLAAPGVRFAYAPNEQLITRLAVLNGDPAGSCPADQDPQKCNPYGLEFPFDEPPLLIAEAAYSYNQEPGALAGTFKLGGYRNFGTYPFQHVITGGVRVGWAQDHNIDTNGDFGFYAVLDQMVYRLPGAGDPKGISIFGRVFATKQRNPADAYWEAGVTFEGLYHRRPDDTFAIGYAHTDLSPKLAAHQKAHQRPVIVSYEAVLEASYTAQIVPGFTLQPDFQYFWNPGGHVSDPDDPSKAIPDAVVMGLRTTINY